VKHFLHGNAHDQSAGFIGKKRDRFRCFLVFNLAYVGLPVDRILHIEKDRDRAQLNLDGRLKVIQQPVFVLCFHKRVIEIKGLQKELMISSKYKRIWQCKIYPFFNRQ
jgi:hypothetical protein